MGCFIIFCIVLNNVFACWYKRIILDPQQHSTIVKYETQQVIFYIDAELVHGWKDDHDAALAELDIFDQEGELEKHVLLNLKPGDTLSVNRDQYPGLRQPIEDGIMELCRNNSIVDLAIFDKTQNEFMTKIHGRVTKTSSAHIRIIKSYSLYNANTAHGERGYFFSNAYEYIDGF